MAARGALTEIEDSRLQVRVQLVEAHGRPHEQPGEQRDNRAGVQRRAEHAVDGLAERAGLEQHRACAPVNLDVLLV